MTENFDFKTLWQEASAALNKRGPEEIGLAWLADLRAPGVTRFLQELQEASKIIFDLAMTWIQMKKASLSNSVPL
ncbi:MAG: hypothetical protein WCD70_14730 [Alphaproteobacteria bacterium]